MILFSFWEPQVLNNELGWAMIMLLIYRWRIWALKRYSDLFQATQLEKGRIRTWKQVSLIPKLAFLSLFHCAAPVFFTHDFIEVWNRSGKLEAFWLQAGHKISRVTAAFGKIQWTMSQIPLHARKTYISPGQDHGEFPVSFFFFFFFK